MKGWFIMDSDKHNLANQNKNKENKNMTNIDELTKQFRSNHRVDIVSLADSLGIQVFAKTLPDSQSGYIQDDNGTIKIIVNRTHPLTRQRFTIAHEVGHFFKHKPVLEEVGQLDRTKEGQEDPEYIKREKKADEVAAQILMPEYMLADYLNNKGWEATTKFTAYMIEEIANSFYVSRTMAVTRLRELGLNLPYISFA